MDKSIEKIWKQGFLNEDALIAPKVNDLYNQKSQNMIDRFHRMFKINHLAIIIGCLIMLPAAFWFGVPFLGLFIVLLLLGLVWIGKIGMKELSLLDKNLNSYDYLKSFLEWYKKVESRYIKAYTFFYPLFFLAFAIRFLFSDDARAIFASILRETPATLTLFTVPWYFIAAMAVIASILAYYGGALYKIDLDIIYGREFEKLHKLIDEMEQLRKE